MKNYAIFLFITISFFANSCSNSTEPAFDLISVRVANNQLKITNITDRTVYLFLVEQNYAAVINWGPSVGDHPSVMGSQSVLLIFLI